MQWILQEFEDTHKLAEALDGLGIPYTWHKVVPFIGELIPEPVVANPSAVLMFGSYTLWRNAEANGYRPRMFKLRPFVQEKVWHPYLLNGADALFLTLREVPAHLADDGREWFLRPVDDSKEEPGNVKTAGEIIRMAERVLSLDEDEIPAGSLRHDTLLMFTKPVRILREWRLWIVNDRIVTYSLYKEGSRVIHRHEIIDVCRTEQGLRLLETNCLNAAGFYAADLTKLAAAIDGLVRD